MKVIEIINSGNIIIDYGLEDGAKEGDLLRIYAVGEPVIAPDGTNLGTFDQVKDTVEVVVPYNEFSLCQKARKITAPVLNPLSEFLSKSAVRPPMNIDPTTASHRKIPAASVIEVGDSVMKL